MIETTSKIELDVVPLQPRKHLDLHLGEDLAAQPASLGGVWQRFVREDVPLANLGRAQRGQCFPCHPRRQSRCRTHRNGFAVRHFDDRVELRFKVVPAFEEPALLRLIGDARLVKVLERHPRSRRAKGVAVEIETAHLSAILLISQSLRRGHRIARVEDVGEVVGRFLLFRPLHRSFLGGLRFCDSVWTRLALIALAERHARSRQYSGGRRCDEQNLALH